MKQCIPFIPGEQEVQKEKHMKLQVDLSTDDLEKLNNKTTSNAL